MDILKYGFENEVKKQLLSSESGGYRDKILKISNENIYFFSLQNDLHSEKPQVSLKRYLNTINDDLKQMQSTEFSAQDVLPEHFGNIVIYRHFVFLW